VTIRPCLSHTLRGFPLVGGSAQLIEDFETTREYLFQGAMIVYTVRVVRCRTQYLVPVPATVTR